MNCPFIYASGRQCCGTIKEARAYGPSRNGIIDEADVRKIRLWCSDKWDHAGSVPSQETKNRMEFYPDDLVRMGCYSDAIAMCENLLAAAE